MNPPCYADITKPTNDLLNKDYPVGSAKLELNTTTANGIKFTANGLKDNKTGGIMSDIKAKYSDKAREGINFTQTWTTSNVLGAQLGLENTIVKGLTLDFVSTLLPEKGAKVAKVGMEFKNDFVFTKSSLDLFKGPTVHADAVLGVDGFVGGFESAFDVAEGKVSNYGALLGFISPLYSVSLVTGNKFANFQAQYWHKVHPGVEAGAKAVWNKTQVGNVTMEVGTKIVLDKNSFFKGKVDSNGRLGLGYGNVLRDGVKVVVGGMFDVTKLGADVHKVGIHFAFEG